MQSVLFFQSRHIGIVRYGKEQSNRCPIRIPADALTHEDGIENSWQLHVFVHGSALQLLDELTQVELASAAIGQRAEGGCSSRLDMLDQTG